MLPGAAAEVDFGEFQALIGRIMVKLFMFMFMFMFVLCLSHSGKAVHVA
jgi:hypothetical protein